MTVRDVQKVPVVFAMVLLAGAASFFIGNSYHAQMPGFATDLGHGDPGAAYTALLGADAAGALLAGILLETRGTWLRLSTTSAFVLAILWGCSLLGFASVRLYPAAIGLLFLAGSAALLAGPGIARAAGLGPAGEAAWGVAQWPLAFALIVAAFWVVYYVLPERDQRGCRRVLLKASAVAAALWLLATLAFRLYVAGFGSYSATYGLLGAVIVLLLWLYVTSLVILLGGELASEWERGT
jgi:hypothetical protein